MKIPRRAATRAQRRRHKARARRILVRRMGWQPHEITPRRVGMYANHITLCSCEMCCNIRRSLWMSRVERLTMAERRAELNADEGEEDYLS